MNLFNILLHCNSQAMSSSKNWEKVKTRKETKIESKVVKCCKQSELWQNCQDVKLWMNCIRMWTILLSSYEMEMISTKVSQISLVWKVLLCLFLFDFLCASSFLLFPKLNWPVSKDSIQAYYNIWLFHFASVGNNRKTADVIIGT